MRFEFAFEKLLAHKRTLEDLARRDFMTAQAAVDIAMKELKEMYGAIEESRKRGGDLSSEGGTKGPQLAQIDEFIRGQNLRIEMHRKKLRELMGEAERLREILVEAAKEKKTLEKLKERRFEEYKLKRKKLDLKEMDELVVTRFKRTPGEP